MNLHELKQAVDRAYNSFDLKDPAKVTVYIQTVKVGSVGHVPCTPITHAHMGIDWESGSFLITPEKSLREIDRDEIKALRDNYEELGWTHYKVSKVKRENEKLKQQLADMTTPRSENS
jgi:hypothetical protein